ncbi:MAG TPA: cation transporter [Planctomycetota bacterium]|nr:cation transporter [Planctomycetota bacterium]
MKRIAAVILGLFIASTMSAFSAETKVVVSDMHICCKSCVAAIDKTLKDVKGVKYTVDQSKDSVTLMADDTASAQAAVDALAGAGFQGKSDNKDVAMKDNSGAPDGKVAKLEVSNIHNCCGKCTEAIDKAVKGVTGVKESTVKPKVNSFTVTGDFEAKALVKALNDAGFHVTVK